MDLEFAPKHPIRLGAVCWFYIRCFVYIDWRWKVGRTPDSALGGEEMEDAGRGFACGIQEGF